MNLKFEDADVEGIISTSVTSPRCGREPTRSTRQEIGDVINVATPTKSRFGATVYLGGSSHWRVTGTSYLTGLYIEPGAKIDANETPLILTVNGRRVPARPGSYSGAIRVQPQITSQGGNNTRAARHAKTE